MISRRYARESKISLSIHLLQCKESLRLRVPEMSGQLGTHNKTRTLKVVAKLFHLARNLIDCPNHGTVLRVVKKTRSLCYYPFTSLVILS